MLEKKFANDEFDIELTLYIDNEQSVWFKGKDIAKILGYSNNRDVIIKHVSEENRMVYMCWKSERDPNMLGSPVPPPTMFQNRP